MRWLRAVAVLFVVTLVQATVVPAFEVRHARPDLVLLVAVCMIARGTAWRGGRWNAFWLGWVAGLLVDTCSAGSDVPFGATALVFGLTAAAVSWLATELFFESIAAQVLILAPVCLAAHAALAAVLVLGAGAPVRGALAQAVGTALYSAAAAPVVFGAVKRIERFLGIRSRRDFGRA